MYPIDFLRVLAVALVTLFPVVNPVGGGPIFNAAIQKLET
jgi:small neutral amino acid transporter SnatA (MarC family)